MTLLRGLTFLLIFIQTSGLALEKSLLVLEKLNLPFSQAGQTLIKGFQFFLRLDTLVLRFETFLSSLETVYAILFLSRCQTRLALDDEFDGSIQFFRCHFASSENGRQRARYSVLYCQK